MKPSLALLLPAAALLVACASPGLTAYHDGVRLYREGYYGSARDAFDTVVREDPRNAAAVNNRGVAKVRLGDLDGAVIDYTLALQLAPKDAEIVFNRGTVRAAFGDTTGAVNDWQFAVDGDRAGAIADLRAAVMAEPDATRRARIDRLLRTLEASR